jgi:hypothetical protein
MIPPGLVGMESETNIPLAPSVMRSSPTAPVIAVTAPQPTPVPTSGGSRWAFVALAAALAAGGYAFWVHRSVTNVQASEATATPPPAAAQAAPAATAPPLAAPMAAAVPAAEPQPGATGSATQAASAAGAKGAPAAAKARPATPPRTKAAAPAPSRPATGGRDELDVGF